MRRGDVIAVPVWQSAHILSDTDAEDESSSEEEGEEKHPARQADELVYFKVTALNYEPLLALEEDFRSSLPSKGRAGELGCWVDIGDQGTTQLVLEGMERSRITGRDAAKVWHGISEHLPLQIIAGLSLRIRPSS